MKRHADRQNWWKDQSGAIAAIAAIGMVVFAGFAGLAVDLGRIVAVKAELQKAADAGALAGARALFPYTSSPLPQPLDWTKGGNVAHQTVEKNYADGNLLSNDHSQAGYWSMLWTWNTAPSSLQPISITPLPSDLPAVRVSISKASGVNGGPVEMLFGPLIGKSTQDVAVKAAAVLAPTGTIPKGSGFPVATPITWVQRNWDANPPVSFRIGSNYHDPDGGQWTSFKTNDNSVPFVRDLIEFGNPDPIAVGDNIYIQPGTETALYYTAAHEKIGQVVMLPIVADDFETHNYTQVLAWVPFYIEDSQGGSDKYIQGHFVRDYVVPGGQPGGSYYGSYAGTPKLVN